MQNLGIPRHAVQTSITIMSTNYSTWRIEEGIGQHHHELTNGESRFGAPRYGGEYVDEVTILWNN